MAKSESTLIKALKPLCTFRVQVGDYFTVIADGVKYESYAESSYASEGFIRSALDLAERYERDARAIREAVKEFAQ